MADWRLLASSLSSSSRVVMTYSFPGSLSVSTDDHESPGDQLLRLLRENQIDLNAVEGLRLIIAFNRIKDSSDRRVLIELAERLSR